jgi:type VI secretion system secreted protein VgrG
MFSCAAILGKALLAAALPRDDPTPPCRVNTQSRESILDSASDFLRLVQHEQSLSTANRQVRLRLAESGFDDVLLPQRVAGAESICGDVEYHVACLTSTPKLRLKELIALPEEIKFVTDCGQLRSVCGLITEARAGDFDGGLAVYYLVVRDALAVMEKRTNSRIFRYQSELDIVKVLFDEWRQSSGVLAAAFEYELDPLLDARQFPPREQMIQYNETDAGFVRRLLKRCGISWYVRPAAAAIPLSILLMTARRRTPWCCSTTRPACRRTRPARCAITVRTRRTSGT